MLGHACYRSDARGLMGSVLLNPCETLSCNAHECPACWRIKDHVEKIQDMSVAMFKCLAQLSYSKDNYVS